MADRYWVGGSGTWNTSSTTNWSATSGGPSGASVPTSADSVFFNQATTYTVTTTGALACLDLTVSAGTVTFAFGTSPTLAISGNFSISSATVWTSGLTITFNATTAKTITTNGVTLFALIAFNGVGGSWQLQGAMTVGTVGTTRTTTLTAGTLDLNGFTYTTGAFSSSNSNVRSIAFGTGNITLIGSGNAWTTSISTNFSRTGTPTVNVSNNSATATTITTGTLTEAQALDFNYTVGTYTLTDTSARYRSLNLTGFAGTFPNSARTIFGSLNVGSTATISAGTNTQTFSATSGLWSITSNGRTLDFPITFSGAGGTWQLADALTSGSARTTTLTVGALDLNGFTYTTGTFSSSNTNVRAIAFGTGQITLTGNNTTIWTNSTTTNFSFTGTFKVVATYTGSIGTRTITQGFVSEALVQSISTTGSSGFILDTSSTDTKSLSGVWNDFDMTGVTGTLANVSRTVYGGFDVGSTVTLTAGANTTTFSATSGVDTITSNGRTLDFPLTFNGVGGTWQLQDALTMGTSRSLTLTNGTFNANNYNVTIGAMSSSNSNVRTLALGSGTWTVAGAVASPWTFSTSTNATITGTATISMTGATAKNFSGGGLTWPVLNQGGAGALTIFGNNTFTDITSTQTTVSACAITFAAGSTQSVSNFTASGTVTGQLTLGSTTTSQYNLVKLGGGDVNVSFCTISYSNASP